MPEWRRWLRLLLVATGILVAYFLVPVTRDENANVVARGIASIVVLVLLGLAVARQLMLHFDRTKQRIDGLIITVMVVAVVFSFVFYALSVHVADQFSGLDTRLDALYFTGATMATIGYGDVHAIGQLARGLVLVLMVFNVVFVGTAVALMSSQIKEVAHTRIAERRHREDSDEV
jgi:hypothetical protein